MELDEIREKIKYSDDQYLQLFCEKGREWGLYVYQDRHLPELPSHNFLRIPDNIPPIRHRGLADVARNTAKATGRSVLRIEMAQPQRFSNAKIENWSWCYLSDRNAVETAESYELSFSPAGSEADILQLAGFNAAWGEDPDLRRRCAERFYGVYAADNALSCWLCRKENEIVGGGEVYVCGDTVRIGTVFTDGAGTAVKTALLNQLIEQAEAQKAALIYTKAVDGLPGFTKAIDVCTVEWRFA